MKTAHKSKLVTIVQIGAGLIGKYLAPLLASIPQVGRLRIIDRDFYSKGQAWHPSQAGRPKAQALAELIQAAHPKLDVDYLIADIADLPLGAFRCSLLATALDSKPARTVANYVFGKLGIRYWFDSGVSAPSLVRVSGFSQGPDAACYGCELDQADYASEQSYPCQPAHQPPPTNSPEYLGALAASLQAADCAKLLSGRIDDALLNRELLYDTASHKLVVTRLVKRDTCRFEHQALAIRQLPLSPKGLTVAAAFALGAGRSSVKVQAAATLEVPGRLFVRELACQCGERRRVLRLKGRLRPSQEKCAKCGRTMSPLGTGLANTLFGNTLSPRELAKPLSSLGLLPADVIALGRRKRLSCFELSNASKDS